MSYDERGGDSSGAYAAGEFSEKDDKGFFPEFPGETIYLNQQRGPHRLSS